MKKVPLKYLKEHLAEVSEAVSHGVAIEITKYHKPYFHMLPCQAPSVRYGRQHGTKSLQPAVTKPVAAGRGLHILNEDREDRR